MLMAAFMLAAAPALASGPGSCDPGVTAGAHQMHDDSASRLGTGAHRKAMPEHRPVHCLASCLAAMAATNPVVPVADAPLPLLNSNPERADLDALVPHPLPVDPPPPRLS